MNLRHSGPLTRMSSANRSTRPMSAMVVRSSGQPRSSFNRAEASTSRWDSPCSDWRSGAAPPTPVMQTTAATAVVTLAASDAKWSNTALLNVDATGAVTRLIELNADTGRRTCWNAPRRQPVLVPGSDMPHAYTVGL